MASLKKEDRFINIAAGGKKLTGEIKRLEEIKPITHEKVFLSESNVTVTSKPKKSEEELYKEFTKEKESLKKYYAKFLSKYSLNIQNNKKEVNDFLYRKETIEDKRNFNNVLNALGEWEKVTTPHYIGETGKWNAYYLTKLTFNAINKNKEFILRFESVDYIVDVYFNGRMVKSHTGFFAPFEVDITDYIVEGENTLLLVVQNDLTTNGITVNGSVHHGNKLYACTNIGYNEPKLGWHHCPAGIGVIGKIYLIESNKQRTIDSFITPNIDSGEIKVKTTIKNYLYDKANLSVYYTLEGRNFKETVFENIEGKIDSLQIGENYLEESFNLNSFRLWTTNEPYLYDLTITLKDKDGNIVDEYQTHFGMRKFVCDLESKPRKGLYYFNNERIMLRGTNEMGHLARAVMENNYDQLIDDILTAKVAGLNFYRYTQRPALTEIYDYFDMLGMLCQSDFPLFSYITDASLQEAYKEVDEMERLTRNHPSVIIESLCNETLDKTAWGKEQYVLSRYDIEKFFDISKGIIRLLNPDRVIKYNEGDYAPLKDTYGISDFHCYTFWYISHALPSGKLRKGYLPPIREDYMCGCGEFGVDGLDRLEIMEKYAPREWLPKNINDEWSPKVIAKEQCYVLHGDFFPEQNTITEWIKASREFQKYAIKQYVDLLRFRSDYIEQTAVHLLIDAWPMGWTKALIDVDRIPKPAFYEFKEANKALRVYLRRDKYVIYKNDSANVEVYVFNDYPVDKNVTANVTVRMGDKVFNYETSGIANACATTYLGEIKIDTNNEYLGEIRVVSKIDDSFDEITIISNENNKKAPQKPLILSKSLECINSICDGEINNTLLFVDRDYYVDNQEEIEKKIYDGAKVFLNMTAPMNILGNDVIFRTHTLEEEVRANNLIFPSKEHRYTKEFDELDFQNFYNKNKDYQDLTAWFKFYYPGMKEILYTLEDSSEEEYKHHKKHKLIMGEISYGKGSLIVSTLSSLDGCIGVNPVLDKLFINIIK